MRSDNSFRIQSRNRSLTEACSDGDVGTVKKLLSEGRSVHETTEEGDSLLSLACSAGFCELSQVLIAMNANVEDRGIKGDCTPLMEAASAGHVDIVSLLIAHGADVNAQSTSGNTPLMYGCAGGHEGVVKVLLEAGANIEDHNENGHTPLMEAASAGHVPVAKILLDHGAGINTHSNEFKESALTLACYKGHLDMVRFLLEAGADQEHKTDEMHTALMEASMDGHVEVARLLLDSGAQVNMPTDSFESPLTLAACGGHVDLAMLLIERGANIEEVNDEGYTPLMEAAREGHEEMVALLLSQGANINAQTEETQETALTLACCGGFLEVADFLIKADADIELGASTPLMEAAQEGHLDLVRYLLESSANVHAQTQTGDTALTYACENGHTDVADLLLQYGSNLEHESEGGRTPLMKACRAGHLCTVQFLLSKRADVNRQTTNNDHTPLSLACAGGHISVVELLLAQSADPFHKLKDNSTMLIEAAKGGHTSVVQLLLDYPHSIMINSSLDTSKSTLVNQHQTMRHPLQVSTQYLVENQSSDEIQKDSALNQLVLSKSNNQISFLRKTKSISNFAENSLSETQKISLESLVTTKNFDSNSDIQKNAIQTGISESNITTLRTSSRVAVNVINYDSPKFHKHEQISHKQQILEELQRVERELQMKGVSHVNLGHSGSSDDEMNVTLQDIPKLKSSDISSVEDIDDLTQYKPAIRNSNTFGLEEPAMADVVINPGTSNVTPALSFYKDFQEANKYYIEGFKEGIKLEKQRMLKEVRNLQETPFSLPSSPSAIDNFSAISNSFPNTSSVSSITVPSLSTSASTFIANPSCISNTENISRSNSLALISEVCFPQPIITSSSVSQNTAISDRPKVKAVSKKDSKNVRKTVHGMVMNKLQQQHMALMAGLSSSDFQKFLEKTRPHCVQQVHQLQQLNQQLQLQLDQVQVPQVDKQQEASDTLNLHLQGSCPYYIDSKYSKPSDDVSELGIGPQISIDDPADFIETVSCDRMSNEEIDEVGVRKDSPFINGEENFQPMIKENGDLSGNNQEFSEHSLSSLPCFNLTNSPMQSQTNSSILMQTSSYEPLQKQVLNAFEAGLSIGIQRRLSDDNKHSQLVLQSNQIAFSDQTMSPSYKINTTGVSLSSNIEYSQDPSSLINQVQVATQTQLPISRNATASLSERKSLINYLGDTKGKKNKYVLGHHVSNQQSSVPRSLHTSLGSSTQSYPINPSTVSKSYAANNSLEKYSTNEVLPTPFSCMDVDSETDSNHDTALTLACAGGHEELVELLLSRGADIEHRDKKGFTPLILAATAGHQKVVEILLNQGADIEAQSERTKDTPLSLACSGGRYEVVELLLNRAANKEHRNVSDYTPLSLAASGGYVNIIKLLLNHGAEINSRTGSKLGISPLMLAAMNGHTAAVKLLLDTGSDINAQIETNRNTALTLACFQGRHEVVSLLLDRKANVEHRAKTGLTPLMEAASGGYVEVGRVLLNKGADVNATPVPSSRDTALTIAADKGHCRFVELLLSKGTQVEVKNKKGNSPLWLAANGGHLNVVDLLYHAGADIDSQDNRKVSCLMAAFRKGHIKIVKWMVNHVMQFPSDQEMTRYVATINDKDLLDRCQECVRIIRAAKETQAAKANKNATILLEELDMEKTREESKKAAAARRRERKKKKKLEKKEEKRKLYAENKRNEDMYEAEDTLGTTIGECENFKENCDRVIQEACDNSTEYINISDESVLISNREGEKIYADSREYNELKVKEKKKEKKKKSVQCSSLTSAVNEEDTSYGQVLSSAEIFSSTTPPDYFSSYDTNNHPADRDDFEATGNEILSIQKGKRAYNQCEIDKSFSNNAKLINNASSKYFGKRDEGWKEVVRKGQIDDSGKFTNSPFRSKKVSVPPNAISRVIGRGGSNINTIRAATGAHIEVEKQNKSQGERIITIKGSFEATKHAHLLISALIKDPDVDVVQLLSKSKLSYTVNPLAAEKPVTSIMAPKMKIIPAKVTSGFPNNNVSGQLGKLSQITPLSSSAIVLPVRSSICVKVTGMPASRSSAPRFTTSDKKAFFYSAAPSNTKTTMSYTSAIMTAGRSTKTVTCNVSQTQTFAAKLSEMTTVNSGVDYRNFIHSNQVRNDASDKQSLSPTASFTSSTVPSNCHMCLQDISAQNLLQSKTTSSIIPAFTSGAPHYFEKFDCQSASSNLANLISSTSIKSATTTVPSPSNYVSLSKSASTTFPSAVFVQASSTALNPTTLPINDLHECQISFESVPLEYSLFNDTFSTVTQQSMWGSRENETLKNINFAAITGGRIPVNASIAPSNKFLENAPVEVDASKAPGYRGTSTCSPTSNNSNNLTNMYTHPKNKSGPTSPIKNAMHTENAQLIDYNNSTCIVSIEPASLVTTRSHLNQNNVTENVTSAAPFSISARRENTKSPQNIATSHKISDISSVSLQSNLEVNIFNLNDDTSNFETHSSGTNLIKSGSNECQTITQPITSIQRQSQNYDQTVTPSTVVTTTVSMSRLNPRAPDFSSSLHSRAKPQVSMLGPSTSSYSNIFPLMSTQPSTSAIYSTNLTTLGGFTYNKYQTPFLRQPNVTAGNQNHWPFVRTQGYPNQDQIVDQANYTEHIIGITFPSSNSDVLSPKTDLSMLPVTSQEISQIQIEDRKPRPIGTERTWKNYSIIGPGGDSDNMNWVLDHEKTVDSWSGIPSNNDANHLFASNSTFNRISSNETDSHKIAETSYQTSVNQPGL